MEILLLPQRIDEFIEAITLSQTLAPQQQEQQKAEPRQQEELAPQEQRQVDRIYYENAVQEMKQAPTEQEAAAALVTLYKALTVTHGDNYKQHYGLLDQLPQKSTLTQLNAETDAMTRIPEINAIIGNEICILRNQSHAFYCWGNL